MKKWLGKTRGGVSGYSFFIFLIKHSNIKLAYFFLKIVAFYFLLFTKKKAIIFYFRKIHGFRRYTLIKNIYKNYVLLGQVMIDKIAFMVRPITPFKFNFEGENHLREMAAQGKGGLLIGAHMGNWEVAGELLDRIDAKVHVVLYDAEHEEIKRLFEKQKIERNFNAIVIKNDFSHLLKIKQAFDNNELVVMHGDRYLDKSSTMIFNFMGKPARFSTSPLYFASRCQVPVSFVFTLKDSLFQYHFYATKPCVFDYPANLKTRKEQIKNMVEVYVSHLETILRKYPTQWFNYFPYWEEETK